MCEKCKEAKQIVQNWVDQQGHERCWYYPELFEKLVVLFDVQMTVDPSLPPRCEFEAGCKRYQNKEYGNELGTTQRGSHEEQDSRVQTERELDETKDRIRTTCDS